MPSKIIKKKRLPKQSCRRCGYKWTPVKKNPKVCPRCKGRLDWLPKPEEE